MGGDGGGKVYTLAEARGFRAQHLQGLLARHRWQGWCLRLNVPPDNIPFVHFFWLLF